MTSEHARKMRFEGVVTRYEPPTASGIQMEGDAFRLTADYTFEQVDQITSVTQTSTVNGKGIFRILIPATGLLMRKSNYQALQDALNRLKMYCEGPAGHTA